MKRDHALAALFLIGWALAGAASAAETTTTPEASPRRHLRQILDRPLYQRWKRRQENAEVGDQQQKGGFLDSVSRQIEKWHDAVRDFFKKLLPDRGSDEDGDREMFGPEADGPSIMGQLFKILAWILLAAFVLFAGVLLYRHLRDRRLSGRAGHVLSRERMQEALDAGEALALGSPEWMKEAERLALEKNYRAVYRALYLALLSGLHAANKIDFRKQRTNWTYVARFRGPSNEREVFASLTNLFDLVWYGLKPARANAVESAKREVTTLLGGSAPR